MVDEIYAEMGKPKPELTSLVRRWAKADQRRCADCRQNGGKLYNEAHVLYHHTLPTYSRGQCEGINDHFMGAHRYQT